MESINNIIIIIKYIYNANIWDVVNLLLLLHLSTILSKIVTRERVIQDGFGFVVASLIREDVLIVGSESALDK